jgi:4a-hydroxytetrahydrobiopterin dehydratase
MFKSMPNPAKQPTVLTTAEIETRLREFPRWSLKNNKLTREISFPTFMAGIAFINRLAPIFEKLDHHADTHILYTKIIFELQRFDLGGKITDRDFVVASAIDKEAEKVYL